MRKAAKIQDLLGETIRFIHKDVDNGSDKLIFFTDSAKIYKMHHMQDCSEDVGIDDICGDLKDLLNSPVLLADASSNNNYDDKDLAPSSKHPYIDDSFTWTFYKLATVNGYVDIKWFGTSNGYYSEKVDFTQIE